MFWHPHREKQWLNDVIKGNRELPCSLELTRFFSKRMGRDTLLEMIKAFNLKHRTLKEFEHIVEDILGPATKNEFMKLFSSFDFEKYGKKYNRKV